MNLTLIRKYKKKDYCIGDLYIEDKFYCNTLEDTVRDINKDGTFNCGEFKISGHTAIPYGKYEVTVNYSPKFKRELPLLKNVPFFEGIRIHRGNTHKDTLGCILVGENTKKGMVLNSTKYEIEIVKKLKQALSKGEKIYIKII